MKILIIVDKSNTAIDRLAQMVVKNNPLHDIRVMPVHPKRNDADTLFEASQLLAWADIVDIHYWKSGEILFQNFSDLFKNKPKILFHFNPYDINQLKWLEKYSRVVVGNESMQGALPYAHLIPYGVDLEFFKYNETYTKYTKVMMSVNRIESKKGVLEVAQACKANGYPFVLVGRVSDGAYMQSVLDVGGVEFYENATDEQLRDMYYQSAIHVCNSVDSYESGTLPILEAMACGTPVLTRNIGHVPDLYNGKNLVVRQGAKEDVEELTRVMKELMENEPWRLKLREAAWDTVKSRDSRLMARKVMQQYNEIWKPNKELVSIIIPTKDNPESFVECVVAAVQQDYEKMELVVADSGVTPVKRIVDELRKKVSIPVKYIHFRRDGYTLAEARNRAVVEAEGSILVFCDDRIRMAKDAVSELVKYTAPRTWSWGVKDDFPKGFVENFSAIFRKDLVEGGMFNERMEWYGGMTQEIRTRFEYGRGFDFVLVHSAKAEGIHRSKSKASRRESIINAKLLIYKLYGKQ